MMFNEEKNLLSKPRRQHPGAMIFNFIKMIKDTIFGLGVGFIITIKESLFYFFIFAVAILLLIIISSILMWFRYTYRVEEGELRIEQGVFIRKKRYIPINRIHKIDYTANIVHRIFRLVKVQIDTASGGTGADLSAVTIDQGEQLREVLSKSSQEDDEIDDEYVVIEESDEVSQEISWKRLFIAGSTSGSAGFILLTILLAFTQAGEIIPEHIYESTFKWFLSNSIYFLIFLGILTLVLIYIIGIAGTMIRYAFFKISKLEDGLFIKRGLLETKELTIPYDRIQAITIEQSIIRTPFKLVTVCATIAGGTFDSREPMPILFPLMHEREVEEFLAKFLPEYSGLATDFVPLSKKGLKFYLFNASIIFILATMPVLYFFSHYVWIPFVLIVISLLFGWFRFRAGGYQIQGKKLTLRRRIFSKVTFIVFHRRLQAMEKHQHKVQLWQDLSTLNVSILGQLLGTSFSLKHMDDNDVNKISAWFSRRKRSEKQLVNECLNDEEHM